MRERARRERALLRDRRRYNGPLSVWPNCRHHLVTLLVGAPRPGREPYSLPFPGVGV